VRPWPAGAGLRPAQPQPPRRDDLRFPDETRRLQLGAGINVLHGWLNTDLEPGSGAVGLLDATKPFPFEDQVLDYVFSEHHLEHLTHPEGAFTLRECHRVLKPGGRIRIATPDLGVLLGLYGGTPSATQARYLSFISDRFIPEGDRDNPVFVINNAFSEWGHRFLYDRRTLRDLLLRVGYVDLAFWTPGRSADPQLRGLERHGAYIGDEEINRFETMVVEATRPPGRPPVRKAGGAPRRPADPGARRG